MKNRFTKLLALFICAFMLMSSFASFSVLADEAEGEEEVPVTWEDIWADVKKPAYMDTGFTSVKERILASGSTAIDPMELLAVIDGYAFYGDTVTGEMIFLVLKDKTLTKEAILATSGIPEYTAFYCTNPYNAGNAKAIFGENESAPKVKEQLLSQIIISFTDIEDDTTTMNSFADAAANQQIIVKNIRGGVRVEYTIGREQVTYLAPRLIRKEKLEALVDQIVINGSEYTASRFKAFYLLKDLNDETLPEKAKEQMKKDYPITEQFAIYACDPTISTQDLMTLEKYVKSYTDYDYETMEADHAETDYEAEDEVPPLFKLALEYRVDGDEITVRCNAGNIRFDSSAYSLSDVQVLPFGGAGDVNNNGFILSPDGSGSLIDFKDFAILDGRKVDSSTLYGQDYAYHTIAGEHREVARMPVFGVYQRVEKDSQKQIDVPVLDADGNPTYDENGNPVTKSETVDVALEIAYLAVIEEGDSLASVNVSYGGSTHNYASVYTSFNPRPKDKYLLNGGLSVGSNVMWTVESERKYTGNFTMRLFILDGSEDGDAEEKSYSDMAAAYREYLIRTGVLTEMEKAEGGIPLYLETLGALETTKTFLGFPYEDTIALTSFQDTIDILEELGGEYGIDNIKVKMSGWYNGGLMGDIATSLEIEECLGGEEGFKELINYAKENNYTLFPDIELSFAYSDNWFDDFDSSEDCVLTIDERSARKQVYDPVWQGFVTITPGEAILSANYMKKLYEKAYADYEKFGVGAISVGTVGEYLSSDFNTDRPLTREDSKELTVQLLDTISENQKVLVNSGNDYTLPYVTDIINMPLDDSRLLISYATVPFMSMVLHGYKEYAGYALNLAGDYEYYLLKTIESGASPYFVVAVDNVAELKQYTYSALEGYYSVRYSTWVDDIVSAYNMINEALSDVRNATMVRHSVLTDDGKVAKVIYETDEQYITFYVNYTDADYEVEDAGVIIPAEGYTKLYNEKTGEGE